MTHSIKSAAMKARWADPDWRAMMMGKVGRGRGQAQTPRSSARFEAHVAEETSVVRPLRDDHPAVVQGRSIFNVNRAPRLGSHILISGMNQRKIGHRIVKGAWKGLPVYTVSLEERATCPRSCKVWGACYGNGMPFAARWTHGPSYEKALLADLFWYAGRHKNKGFAVRLHVLGDFYSTDYVNLWTEALQAIPRLHVWGYTAHPRDSIIGRKVAALNAAFHDRCVIRFSGKETIVVRSREEAREVGAIVCPAETGGARNCGECALCWAEPARKHVVAFLLHGNPRIGRDGLGGTDGAEAA